MKILQKKRDDMLERLKYLDTEMEKMKINELQRLAMSHKMI